MGTPLNEIVVALLLNISRLELNSRCVIRIFQLYEIFLITLWPLFSVRSKYQKYFLGAKGDLCVELTTLPPSRVFEIFSGSLI